MLPSGIGFIALGIWTYLLLFRGMFWRVAPLLRRPAGSPRRARIAVVIPARDEAEVIGEALDGLLAQRYDGELAIFVVDDESSDDTAEIARSRGVTVVRAPPLAAGWTGKLWAVAHGVEAASAWDPEYFLLTDADIAHGPTSVADLVARDLPMASVMVKLRCESRAERLLVPAFVFFFFKLYPPRWIADPGSQTAGAAGGCILIRRDMLERIGGIASIRGELIDDCALAKAVKRQGPIWLGMSADTRSLRAYGSFASVWNMVARTAYTQLDHSPLLLAGTAVGMFLTYLAPIVGGWPGFVAWTLMSVAYAPMLRFYRQPLLTAPLLPLVALFYSGATVTSAIRYWRGAGGQWKGRLQDRRQ